MGMQVIELSDKFLAEVDEYPKVPLPWARAVIKIQRNADREAQMLKDMFGSTVSPEMLEAGVKSVIKTDFSLDVEGDTVRQKIDGKTVIKYTREGEVLWVTEGIPTNIVPPMVKLINKVAWTFFKPKTPAPSSSKRAKAEGQGGQVRQTDTLRYKTVGSKSYVYHASEDPRHYTRHTEAWEVRSYVRRYKSGLTIIVKGHTRGNGVPKEKPYKL